MIDLCRLIWFAFVGLFRSRASLEAEILAVLTEAYGWEQGSCYLVRDRDSVYGDVFIRRLGRRAFVHLSHRFERLRQYFALVASGRS